MDMNTKRAIRIYDDSVELRELLNKIPDWKDRMSAQFLVCIRIGNRELRLKKSGDRRSLSEAILALPTEMRMRVLYLTNYLHEKGKYMFSTIPKRYALRAFIMSVILGQEYAEADAISLIGGLREGVTE